MKIKNGKIFPEQESNIFWLEFNQDIVISENGAQTGNPNAGKLHFGLRRKDFDANGD